MTRDADFEDLMTTDDYTRFVGISRVTAERQRMRGDGPPFLKLSKRCVRYRRSDVAAWLEASVRSSTSDPGRAT